VTTSDSTHPRGFLHRIVKKRTYGLLPIVAVLALASIAADAPSGDEIPSSNAGPKNIVQLDNRNDGTLLVKGHVQLGRIPGAGVGPGNIAIAVNTCHADCTTLAVALQVNLFDKNVQVFTPQNGAVAVNAGCDGCHAIAVAYQTNIGVDDPTHVPPDVNKFVATMRAEMARIDATSTSLDQAINGMNGVIAQYAYLVGYLSTARDEKLTPPAKSSPSMEQAPTTDSTAAPSAPASESQAQSPSESPAQSPPPSPTPEPSPSPDQTPAASPSPSSVPEPSPTPT